jgi:hypothetical protein
MDNWSRLEVVHRDCGHPADPHLARAHCHEPLDARAIDARVVAPQGPAVRLVLVAAHAACDICDQPTMVRAVRARADREPRCADSASQSDRRWERTPLT